jgi:hypothetical protein
MRSCWRTPSGRGGAGVVNPYVAFETIDDMIREGLLTGIDHFLLLIKDQYEQAGPRIAAFLAR